jgi:hypothetical protein
MQQPASSVATACPGVAADLWIQLAEAVGQLGAADDLGQIARTVVDAARRLAAADGADLVLRDGAPIRTPSNRCGRAGGARLRNASSIGAS